MVIVPVRSSHLFLQAFFSWLPLVLYLCLPPWPLVYLLHLPLSVTYLKRCITKPLFNSFYSLPTFPDSGDTNLPATSSSFIVTPSTNSSTLSLLTFLGLFVSTVCHQILVLLPQPITVYTHTGHVYWFPAALFHYAAAAAVVSSKKYLIKN